ncbi:MAG UNVERIFIED_CONTAM: 30S ribosomal protein S6 [Rickettsiaceae bacterium]|jgi:small subunit ribosomal protein S6
MPLYETVFIIRQDVSSADLDKITESFLDIIKNNNGEIVKQEYWGIRNLAYEINNNRKGHYVFLGTNSPTAAIAEMERKMKYSIDVIRFMTQRVEEISKDVSPILKNNNVEIEEIVDVTVLKDQ